MSIWEWNLALIYMCMLVELVYLYLNGLTIKEEIPGSYSLNVTQWLKQIPLWGNYIFKEWPLKSPHSTLGLVFHSWTMISLTSVPSPPCTLLQKSRKGRIRNASEKRRQEYVLKNCDSWLFLGNYYGLNCVSPKDILRFYVWAVHFHIIWK